VICTENSTLLSNAARSGRGARSRCRVSCTSSHLDLTRATVRTWPVRSRSLSPCRFHAPTANPVLVSYPRRPGHEVRSGRRRCSRAPWAQAAPRSTAGGHRHLFRRAAIEPRTQSHTLLTTPPGINLPFPSFFFWPPLQNPHPPPPPPLTRHCRRRANCLARPTWFRSRP